MNDISDKVILTKNENYQEILSNVNKNEKKDFSKINNKNSLLKHNKSISEPDYKLQSCKFDSSRIYSEKTFLTNFRC